MYVFSCAPFGKPEKILMAVPLSGAGIFTALLQYFPKNPALLAQKLVEKINLSNFVSIYSKKNATSIKLEGGGG